VTTASRDDEVGLGLDLPAVTEWITANVTGVIPPFTARFISGGRSN